MTAADATVRSRGSRINGKGIGHGAAGARVASTSRAEVVVLRRQGGDRKRQEQVLLNNVIEETASRLVAEARKSKVKALVGAFETVISLQEGGKTGPPATAATTTAVAQ
jgi:D-arabinose 1-dehydrogenase-like Zn-dependent alcohol dehydrogenase